MTFNGRGGRPKKNARRLRQKSARPHRGRFLRHYRGMNLLQKRMVRCSGARPVRYNEARQERCSAARSVLDVRHTLRYNCGQRLKSPAVARVRVDPRRADETDNYRRKGWRRATAGRCNLALFDAAPHHKNCDSVAGAHQNDASHLLPG